MLGVFTISLLMALVFMCGDVARSESPQNQKASESAYTKEGTPLSCPNQVSADDVIYIDLPQPHGQEMAIITPKGHYFMVAYKPSPSVLPPKITPEIFINMKQIQIDPKIFTASLWTSGVDEYKRPFNEQGVYEIRMGDVLETEAGFHHIWRCYIKYIHK